MNDWIRKTAMAAVGCILLGTNSFAQKNRLVDPQTPPGSVPMGYKLVFSDEFNGTELDRAKWKLGINGENIQNIGVDCIYVWENISLRDGLLVFTQRREDAPVQGPVWGDPSFDFHYSSGGLNTDGTFDFGNDMAVEIRFKLPSNSGGYAAFWGMAGKKDAPPEDRLELDLFEYIADSNKQRFWSGLWWHDFRPGEVAGYVSESEVSKHASDRYFVNDPQHKGHFQPDDAEMKLKRIDYDDFIRFAFKVDGDEMSWHIHEKKAPLDQRPYMIFEGGEVHSRAYLKGDAPKDCWERDIPKKLSSNLIINYAMRDFEWAGGPINDAQLPAEMVIDYIRVYQTN
jgi:hypothetical protein